MSLFMDAFTKVPYTPCTGTMYVSVFMPVDGMLKETLSVLLSFFHIKSLSLQSSPFAKIQYNSSIYL